MAAIRDHADPKYSQHPAVQNGVAQGASAAQRPSDDHDLTRASNSFDKTPVENDEEKRALETQRQSREIGQEEFVDPFGNEDGAEVQYRTMEWWHVGLLMVAETISLGILSLPSAVAALGWIPGTILIVGFGLLATYSGYVIGQFKLAYPQVHSFADAGELIAGPIGREILGAGQVLVLVFIVAAHVLTFSVMMNVLTEHGTCSIVFAAVGAVVSFGLTLPRTLQKVSYLSIASCISITAAILVTMVGVGITKPGLLQTFAVGNPVTHATLTTGTLGLMQIIVAYSGHIAFFGFISELRDPRSFRKALFLLQGLSVAFYITVGVVIYYFAGASVGSPALGATSPVLRKVAYGIAMPTIVVAGVINGHVAAKYIYVRMWRGTNVMRERSARAYGSWYAICATIWLMGWVIAEAVPAFNQLLALVGSLFCTWFSFGCCAYFWLWMNWGSWNKGWRKRSLVVVNLAMFAVCCALCGIGLYASGKEIHDGHGGQVFSCADNSHPK
ncbi:hypothetical protein B0A49_07190 [Cryomyces minteri]|uniref:Amino acid transporter transmembrane domain-containing protein n=1 Tax=Cryomyces minteri TaxID=331657 RepID=A0A4U0WJE2_9PEZI|nr:hypothetical protein B0A49_07190 [Cryomyces minteri]